jgi:hypothetical protein
VTDHHWTETEFVDAVVRPWLHEEFGAGSVFEGVHLSLIDRYPDFVVDAGGDVVWMVEVEDDRGSVIDGIGQAITYAGVDGLSVDVGPPDATHLPVLICPMGETHIPEITILSYSEVHIKELDAGDLGE